MPSYNLIKSYTDIQDPDAISVSPYWIVCFVGLQTPLSYSRQNRTSVKTDATQGSRSKLVVTDDCVNLDINNAKENHTKSARFNLLQSQFNYLDEVIPGDWVMVWTFNSKEKFQEVYKKVVRGDQCNDFQDGLKFLGRVNSVRLSVSVSPNGNKHSAVSVDAFGFRELDSEFFYDTALAENLLKDGNNLSWLARINLDIKSLFETKANGTTVEDNGRKIIANLVKILVGSGVRSEEVNPLANQGISSSAGSTTQEAPYAYIVPGEIASLFGKQNRDASKPSNIISYADLLALYTGVQTQFAGNDDSSTLFAPYISKTDGIERFTGIENLGCYAPTFVGFVNKPLWSLLQQYQNPVVNELFTCLRTDENGNITPQIIFRQIPFTTPTFAQINSNRPTNDQIESNKNNISYDVPTQSQQKQKDSVVGSASQIPVTPFHSLPRWKLHPVMVKNLSLGRSDGLRTNYVHIYGQNGLYAAGSPSIVQQLVLNPPAINGLDIQMNGLRTFMTTVSSGFLDEVGHAPSAWIDLASDFMMGAHLTLNGTIDCVGIHLPICEGDNLEFQGMLFHIESVNHSCSISPEGQKTFATSLTLTNGVKTGSFSSTDSDIDAENTFYLGFDKKDIDPIEKVLPSSSYDSEFPQVKITKNGK